MLFSHSLSFFSFFFFSASAAFNLSSSRRKSVHGEFLRWAPLLPTHDAREKSRLLLLLILSLPSIHDAAFKALRRNRDLARPPSSYFYTKPTNRRPREIRPIWPHQPPASPSLTQEGERCVSRFCTHTVQLLPLLLRTHSRPGRPRLGSETSLLLTSPRGPRNGLGTTHVQEIEESRQGGPKVYLTVVKTKAKTFEEDYMGLIEFEISAAAPTHLGASHAHI